MYGLEWLVVLGLLGLTAGFGGGYLLANRLGAGGTRMRELEAELDAARQNHVDYRKEVVAQFSETARRFQTLNDSYTDLHQQLARSSSILCGDFSGPLLTAPSGHQDLIPSKIRQPEPSEADGAAAELAAPVSAPQPDQPGNVNGAPGTAVDEQSRSPARHEPPVLEERVEAASEETARAHPSPRQADTGETDIRVAEPGAQEAAADSSNSETMTSETTAPGGAEHAAASAAADAAPDDRRRDGAGYSPR